MHRASNTFNVLQAVAATVSLAIILWSLGLPSFRFAEAANVTSFSDTLSTSEPSVVSNHTISFVATNGVAAGQTITLTFPAGFNMGSVAFGDIDFTINGTDQTLAAAPSGATWGAAVSGQVLTLTSGTGVVTSGQTVVIEIGTNATFGTTGTNQITNPGVGSYEIDATSGTLDSGSTRVAIVAVVTVTASVDTVFQFTVTGVAGNQSVNGTTTGGTTTATNIPFGVLQSGSASTAAQDLTVITNASNGFVVTVVADGQLTSSTGADIDSFANGGNQVSPAAWSAPSGTVGLENTYGHWGITSDDTDYFAATETYVAASTTPVSVFAHTGPIDGTVTGQGTTRVGYTVQISSLQEAANDYTATLTYVATPVF